MSFNFNNMDFIDDVYINSHFKIGEITADATLNMSEKDCYKLLTERTDYEKTLPSGETLKDRMDIVMESMSVYAVAKVKTDDPELKMTAELYICIKEPQVYESTPALTEEEGKVLLERLSEYYEASELADFSLKDMLRNEAENVIFEQSITIANRNNPTAEIKGVDLFDKCFIDDVTPYYFNDDDNKPYIGVLADFDLEEQEIIEVIKANTTYIQDYCGGDIGKLEEIMNDEENPIYVSAEVVKGYDDKSAALTARIFIEAPIISDDRELSLEATPTATYKIELDEKQQMSIVKKAINTCSYIGETLYENLQEAETIYKTNEANLERREKGTTAVKDFMESLNIELYSTEEKLAEVEEKLARKEFADSADYFNDREELKELLADGYTYVIIDNGGSHEMSGAKTGEDIFNYFSDDLTYDHLASGIYENAETFGIDLKGNLPLDELALRCVERSTDGENGKAFYESVKADVEQINDLMNYSKVAYMEKLVTRIDPERSLMADKEVKKEATKPNVDR